ncbi:hypothetical protein ACFQV8_06135 [Pseudonocardia benzenivorans]
MLEALGYAVELPPRAVCCGLTWKSTGQLDTARKVVARSLRTIRPWLTAGVPVVGLEPSCTAALRADAAELLPDDPDVALLADGVRTFAEVLARHADELPDWSPRPAAARSCRCTATSTPSWASTPTGRSCARWGSTPRCWTRALRARRRLRVRGRPLRRLDGVRRTRPAAGRPGGRRRCRGAGRRLQLPDPAASGRDPRTRPPRPARGPRPRPPPGNSGPVSDR